MERYDVHEDSLSFIAEWASITKGLGSPDNTRFLLAPTHPNHGQYSHEKCTAHMTILQHHEGTNTTTALRLTPGAHYTTNVYTLTILTGSGDRTKDADLSNFSVQSRVHIPITLWYLMTNLVHNGESLMEVAPNDVHPRVTDDEHYAHELAEYASPHM